MLNTPKGLRLHIGLFGQRNAGKSSLINALTNQKISIVSNVAGTTTDPVEKAYELHPVGPVVFIDTAGIDDTGTLGLQRVARSHSILGWVDIALIVTTATTFGDHEKALLNQVKKNKTPAILVVNQTDIRPTELKDWSTWNVPVVLTSTNIPESIDQLRNVLIQTISSQITPDRPLAGDLVHRGDTVLLVTPIDSGAPKGRLILPQVQAIREILDTHAKCIVVQRNRVAEMLSELKKAPCLVITDSQVIHTVAPQVPQNIPLTTFSTQMAYSKSDIDVMAEGAATIAHLKPNDRILICETCSHHPQEDDIGRIKIPRLLQKYVNGPLHIDFAIGKDFPLDLSSYKLIIQCGGCIVSRQHMLSRIRQAQAQNVPITNYGLTISFLQGHLERVLSCHPEALQRYRQSL